MNLKSLSALGAGLLLAACSQAPRTDSLTQYVDMRIGTGGHGHVFMGANVPFGAVQLGPTSIPQSWDWTSGYHISDTTVIGFSHTHLNGTGIGDLFDVTVMPVVGQVTYARGTEDDPQSGMWSYFSHANEKARPGYYATRLDRYGIDVELTATKRVGLHKYTFPASADAAVVFDLENGGCWDAPTETFIERADDHTISGYRYSTGWAKDQRVYFTAEFSKPFKSLAIYEGGEDGGLREGDSFRAERLYGRVGFDTSAGETIYVKVAISPVSIENARLNMQAELPGWDFEATAAAADRAWNAELQKVRIETSDGALPHDGRPVRILRRERRLPRFRRQDLPRRAVRELYDFLAVGHLSRRPAPHDDPPPREDARHRQYDAPYLPAAGQASRMAPDG